MEIALSWKPGIVSMTGEGINNPLNQTEFELGNDSDFSNIYNVLNTGERSEQEKNYKNKIKTTFGPPLIPIKLSTQDPTSDKSQGGVPTPGPPPLDPRMNSPQEGNFHNSLNQT